MEQNNLAKSTCPNCGYCPHCGRGGHQAIPYYPIYPYYPVNPWYSQPFGGYYGITCTSGNLGASPVTNQA